MTFFGTYRGFSCLYATGSCCLEAPGPQYAWPLEEEGIFQGQLNICSSARFAPPTLLSRLMSSSVKLPRPLTQTSFRARVTASHFCKWPDRIFSFAGLTVSVATTQLNVASKVATDNSARLYINDRCGCSNNPLQKQTAGRLGSGTAMGWPLL